MSPRPLTALNSSLTRTRRNYDEEQMQMPLKTFQGARKILLSILVILIACAAMWADECLYLSAGNKVTVFQLDEKTCELTLLQSVDLPGAGPMTASPGKRFMYVTAKIPIESNRRKRVSKIATFSVEENGRLKQIHIATVKMSAGYLKPDKTGQFLAGNNYGPGKVSIWKLSDGIYRGETVQEFELEPKAHCSVFSPSNRYLLVPATGPNKVFQIRFDEKTGAVSANDPPHASGPSGEDEARQPRHLVFHPKLNIVYTTNERERPGIGVWKWNPENGTLKTIQNVVTYPKDFDGNITTSALHVTHDGRFVYIANRDITDRRARIGKDSIVGFSIDATTGRLEMIGHFPCEHVPRSFALNESGRFVFVAGQMDDQLGVYTVDQKTGNLKRLKQYPTGSRPSWVHCMTPPASFPEGLE